MFFITSTPAAERSGRYYAPVTIFDGVGAPATDHTMLCFTHVNPEVQAHENVPQPGIPFQSRLFMRLYMNHDGMHDGLLRSSKRQSDHNLNLRLQETLDRREQITI